MFVINDFRQKGIGKQLMKKAFSFANEICFVRDGSANYNGIVH
ncbi:GNAT family N-acetyltransferase [Bacillus pumilus]|nr:GNAT family N-acetyltransferase [Bacillus pumilus]